MSSNLARSIDCEERNLEKEEKWVMREVKNLEEFKKDLEKLLKYEINIKIIQSHFSDRNWSYVKRLCEEEEKEIKNLQRQLGKGERRRIRYEKRVISHLAEAEKDLDTLTVKKINDLLSQVKVYSARSLSELSLNVGKINTLLPKGFDEEGSVVKVDLATINKHLQEVIAACQSLTALLSHLKQLFEKAKNNQIQKMVANTNPIVPNLANLTPQLKEMAIKTAYIKSAPVLKAFMEREGLFNVFLMRGLNGNYNFKWQEKVEDYRDYLQKHLSSEEIGNLKKLSHPVPPKAILYLYNNSKSPHPGIVYNPNNLPDFSQGWVFHAIGELLLKIVAKEGFLSSPIDQINLKKKYFSFKNNDPRRITDGISLAFEDYEKYFHYASYPDPQYRGREVFIYKGGCFFFPLKDVFKPGLILDFYKTVDGYPEIDLKDVSYLKFSPKLLSIFLDLTRDYLPDCLEDFDPMLELFILAKKNISYLESWEDKLKVHNPGVPWSAKDSLEISRENGEMIVTWMDYQHYYDKRETGRTILFRGKNDFFEKIFTQRLNERFCLHAGNLPTIIHDLKENNFFNFFFTHGGLLSDDFSFDPHLSTFAPGENQPFSGTFLEYGNAYVDENKLRSEVNPFILLTYLKQKKDKNPAFTYNFESLLNEMKKLSPRKIKKLILATRAEIILALGKITEQRFRTHFPCTVEISKGIVSLSEGINSGITNNLVKQGMTVTYNVPYEAFNIHQNQRGMKYWQEDAYLYLEKGQVMAHLRKSNKNVPFG